jgi:hypothetical protein
MLGHLVWKPHLINFEPTKEDQPINFQSAQFAGLGNFADFLTGEIEKAYPRNAAIIFWRIRVTRSVIAEKGQAVLSRAIARVNPVQDDIVFNLVP